MRDPPYPPPAPGERPPDRIRTPPPAGPPKKRAT